MRALAAVTHSVADIGASIASGSFQTAGMVVIPCSIHTLAAVAYCQADNLLTRAADVTLKERRRLVLVVRETPLHRGHLAAMLAAADAGAVIMPPVPGFYGQPKTVDDLVNFTVGRVLDLLDIDHRLLRRWGDPPPAGRRTIERGAARIAGPGRRSEAEVDGGAVRPDAAAFAAAGQPGGRVPQPEPAVAGTGHGRRAGRRSPCWTTRSERRGWGRRP